MASTSNKRRAGIGAAATAFVAILKLLDSPEARRALAAISTQTTKWAEHIRNRRPDDGGGLLSPLKPDYDASKLLFRLKGLEAAAKDLAAVDTVVSTGVCREVSSLRAKVSAAKRLPKDVGKPKLKELASVIEQLELQIAAAITGD